jgi:hypothetical protein
MIKVVRWSTEIIKADDLICQEMTWGGFKTIALSFCPYTNENDERFLFWKDMVQEHHKKVVYPNKYLLDVSELPYKSEDELTKIAQLAYSDFKLAKFLKKKLGINLTLAINDNDVSEIVEFRICNHCNTIKIYDLNS